MVESNQPASFTATAYRWICRADGLSKGVGSSDFPYDFVIDIIGVFGGKSRLDGGTRKNLYPVMYLGTDLHSTSWEVRVAPEQKKRPFAS